MRGQKDGAFITVKEAGSMAERRHGTSVVPDSLY